jgi:hypothetical protein
LPPAVQKITVLVGKSLPQGVYGGKRKIAGLHNGRGHRIKVLRMIFAQAVDDVRQIHLITKGMWAKPTRQGLHKIH